MSDIERVPVDPVGDGRSTYLVKHSPDGTSWTARENLSDVIERELLGPAGGPEEVLEGSPDAAYLVGRIAPAKIKSGTEPLTSADEDEPVLDLGEAADTEISRGVPMSSVDETSAESDEDNVDDIPQQRGLMIPASMGLRFQVPNDLERFEVRATWGVYNVYKGEDGEEGTKSKRRRYKREDFNIPKEVRLADLTPGETREYHLRDTTVVRVDRYDDPTHGRVLIELALCNDRETPRQIPVNAWMYQTKLEVSADGEAVFLPVRDLVADGGWSPDEDEEIRRLDLQYRNRLEFAQGRTCSADWETDWDKAPEDDPAKRRAKRVWTTWLPVSETPQTAAQEVPGVLLDMTKLAGAESAVLESGLRPIVAGYDAWLKKRVTQAEELPAHLRDEALRAVEDARMVYDRLADGLDFLLADADAQRCFKFMNEVMSAQRIQTQVAAIRTADTSVSMEEARERVLAGNHPHHWRTFQLAFILTQIRMMTDPAWKYRSGSLARAQLLFFPTGGGKTEAYLGLAAFTFAIRRLQGKVESESGPLDGNAGVAVIMRYTLRLLTSQQFQRATALMCAAETVRIADTATWGDEPFRIGLWVGTSVSPKRFDEANDEIKKAHKNKSAAHRLTVLQIQRCPWCGEAINLRDIKPDPVERRVRVYCGDELAECPFAEGGDAAEGLPVLTVDEEIYRLAPAFVIATVDKFARLAREGEAASLFGYVSKYCDRHGYVHPDYANCDIVDGGQHPRKDGRPAARVRPVGRLRPPDLIIQDELHLITGSLGTTVGLFETVVDTAASWTTADGSPVRPMLVASTATARNATDQVKALYGRDTMIFPPQVIDAGDTYFSEELPVTKATPGRRYVGVSATGVRLTSAEIRVAEILMASGQLLINTGKANEADPYMTLVGYFSATRELAGMARFLGDDIQTLLQKGREWSKLPRRGGSAFGHLNTAELTSRISSAEIGASLDQMAVPFDPAFDSTAAKRALAEAAEHGEAASKRDRLPLDTVLATSMLQVGVDVTRLGLMMVVGQPKNTAEYIQASSRVGRDAKRPGLVVALGNWARPRDLTHFETFRHYHETFYAQVEALSVTPFSQTSLDRGLDGVLVSAARVLQADRAQGLSPEREARRIEQEYAFAQGLIGLVCERVARASDNETAKRARTRLENRLDQWVRRNKQVGKQRQTLVYDRVTDDSRFGALMISPENARSMASRSDIGPFKVPNSMREVQPEINLLVSPIAANLFDHGEDEPEWETQRAKKGASS
ncbi:DISARM system helicase DrmA [Glycomyces tritici]|uniref:DISARM system helicase DrmA n=1 Tax=Glycomyces tritici TaxID=2665176 RepID=A0ABT7YXR1_9ACTN|nr:DISARM system helicase DrmA [Glycomyces tritici]MDN3243427.1 DISARM system helicase DrmA [Glycomyces tritici]